MAEQLSQNVCFLSMINEEFPGDVQPGEKNLEKSSMENLWIVPHPVA
jgi:hypothetical protein